MDKRKPLPINPKLKEYAVEMRKNMTDEEKKVWYQILKDWVSKIFLNIYNGSGECVTVESYDSTTFEGSRRELSTARKT